MVDGESDTSCLAVDRAVSDDRARIQWTLQPAYFTKKSVEPQVGHASLGEFLVDETSNIPNGKRQY